MNANEQRIFNTLRKWLDPRATALLPQVGDRTGAGTSRHVDAIGMGLWPSRGLSVEGYEFKCSRSDWLRELAAPEKADEIFGFCDHWWIVITDADIVKDGELPPTWGLLLVAGEDLTVHVKAPRLCPRALTREFVASVLRCAWGVSPNGDALAAEYKRGFEAGRQPQSWSERNDAQFRENIAAFERASGIDLSSYRYTGEKIGAAVRAVLDGEHEALERVKWLRQYAADVVKSCDETLGKKTRRSA